MTPAAVRSAQLLQRPALAGLLPGEGRRIVSPHAVAGGEHTVFFEPVLLLGENPALKQLPLPLRQLSCPVAKTPPQHCLHSLHKRRT